MPRFRPAETGSASLSWECVAWNCHEQPVPRPYVHDSLRQTEHCHRLPENLQSRGLLA